MPHRAGYEQLFKVATHKTFYYMAAIISSEQCSCHTRPLLKDYAVFVCVVFYELASNTTLGGVSLDMFILPQENMSRYFRYSGSLTTPNCSEAVTWTLFESTIPLSRKQVAF